MHSEDGWIINTNRDVVMNIFSVNHIMRLTPLEKLETHGPKMYLNNVTSDLFAFIASYTKIGSLLQAVGPMNLLFLTTFLTNT